MKKSYVILSLLLTAVLGYVFSFLYQPELNTGVSHRTGRIDISTSFKDNEKAPFIIKYEESNLAPAEWMKNNKRFGYVIENTNQRAEFEITANKDCDITLNLRGPWILKDKNNRNAGIFEQWVDFKRIKINGKNILKKVTPVWHNKPFNYTFKIRRNETVHIKARWKKHYEKTDVSLLFIVLVLSFLFSYKVVKYLASFKVLELRSRIDIVFLSFFAVILFLPMSNISTLEKSTQENRILAKKPHFLLSNAKINTSYGTEFENWFNDRFFGRAWLIKGYSKLQNKLLKYKKNKQAFQLDDDMIFNTDILKQLLRPIPNNDLELFSLNISKLQSFCNIHNIKLYIIIPPAKEDVFKEKFPLFNPDKTSPIDALVRYIHNHNNLDIMYPRNIYLQKHKDFTHFKTDHHWTEYGAFLAYQQFEEILRKDFPDITLLTESDFDIFYNKKPRLGSFKNLFDRPFYDGSDCNRLSLSSKDCPLQYNYKYYNHKDRQNLHIKYGPINMSRVTHYDKGINKRVTLLGNSYGGFLMQFLPYNFKDTQMLRVNNEEKNVKNVYDMKRFEKHILDFQTDILIFYLASSYIYEFKNLYPKD